MKVLESAIRWATGIFNVLDRIELLWRTKLDMSLCSSWIQIIFIHSVRIINLFVLGVALLVKCVDASSQQTNCEFVLVDMKNLSYCFIQRVCLDVTKCKLYSSLVRPRSFHLIGACKPLSKGHEVFRSDVCYSCAPRPSFECLGLRVSRGEPLESPSQVLNL